MLGDFRSLVPVANLDLQANCLCGGKWVSGNRHEDRWKQHEHARLSESSSLLAERSAEPFTGTLAKPFAGFQELRQKQWRVDSITNDSIAMEPFAAAVADEHLSQVQDEDMVRFQSGPLPGDLAEVEAFCRIFRIAEQVHKAIMEALCFVNNAREPLGLMPDGYGSTSLMDAEDSRVKDVPLLEERVVSNLGCIGALLHQHKQEVLCGRLSGLRSSPIPQDDALPPLAQFRAEMKKCCEQLEAALYDYFPSVDKQFTVMLRKLQRLRNVCFDAGCPRPVGSPSHADVPNWAAVQLLPLRGDRTLETDSSTVFWRGGLVTEEGLSWLIKEGFKVIVDLRAENSADQCVKFALDAAISSRKFRHVKLPVDPGKSPTKDQVAQFVRLVADPGNHPLYLHSQEGLGRTSAMVARWREIAIRCAAVAQAKAVPQVDHVIHDRTNSKASCAEKGQEVKHFLGCDNCNSSNGSSDHDRSDSNHISAYLCTSKKNGIDIDAVGKGRSEDKFLGPSERHAAASSPFEAQRPAVDVFSKQAMSNFLKERQVLPTSCVWNRTKKVAKLNLAGEDAAASVAGPARNWELDGPGIPRAGRKVEIFNSSYVEGKAGDANMPFVSDRISDVSENSSAGDQEDMASQKNGASVSTTSEIDITKGACVRVRGVQVPLHDTHEPDIIGDMCASRTGVVRLQSRKKAEMYLVRTDGFSCTREKVKESTLAFTHPSTQQQMLMWKTAPKTILLLKKLGNELMQEARQVASFLHYQEGMNIVVEPEVHDHFARLPGFSFVQTFCNQDASDLHERVDFVVCLGGDGVILHASNLFRDAVPPVVSFNLGSLGFLTVHPFEDFMQDLRAIIHGNSRVEGVYITLRMRLRCEFFRDGKSIPGKKFDVLNEVVVDRGSNPYLCKIECFERNRLITKVQADGVIVATPTGSTAYSTAAGGSMVHPNVPCMLFTPICPHSLSFRPVILPDSALLELKVPEDARSNAWVSFDGKKRQQLSRGDSVRVCMSKHPLPTVNKSDQTDDWFHSLVRCLNWNERLDQKGWTASS